MKKIFFLNSCRQWGGGEKWTFDTARELDKRGYDVTIGSIADSELLVRAKNRGIKIKVVPVRGSLSVLNPIKLFSIVKYLKVNQIDVIFLNLSQDLKFGAIAAKLAGVEKIIYRRGSAIPIKNRFYTKLLLNDCVTDIIANSLATKKTILENTSQWLDEEKIEIIYNGIKVEEIKKTGINRADIRKEFSIDKGIPLLGCVGRLSKQKGHKYLVQAIDLVRDNIDNFKVLVIGKGELENEIKDYVRDLKLDDYIIFTGFRSDIYNIMSQIDFLVHTALWEGFGFVIAEAMAVGKPVVSTNISNIAEIIEDGKSGYLAESKNPEDIAAKIVKMIRNSNKKQMGQMGRKIIESKFAFQEKVSQLEVLYFK